LFSGTLIIIPVAQWIPDIFQKSPGRQEVISVMKNEKERKGISVVRQLISLISAGFVYVVVDGIGHWLCPGPLWTPQCTEVTRGALNTLYWAGPLIGYTISFVSLRFRGRHKQNRAAQISASDDSQL
jgi:hypothetical protein